MPGPDVVRPCAMAQPDSIGNVVAFVEAIRLGIVSFTYRSTPSFVEVKPLQEARLGPNRIGGVEVEDSYGVKGVACQFSATKSDQG